MPPTGEPASLERRGSVDSAGGGGGGGKKDKSKKKHHKDKSKKKVCVCVCVCVEASVMDGTILCFFSRGALFCRDRNIGP